VQAFSGSTSTGAMTYSFIKAVESEPGTTYGRLLTAMRATIRDNGGELGIPGPIGTFFHSAARRYTSRSSKIAGSKRALLRLILSLADPLPVLDWSRVQEPQLCASETFDIYRKPFLL
jgi:hypothetical protein